MELIHYEYTETESEKEVPSGHGWEFWGMRITPAEEKAVWRRLDKNTQLTK